MNLDEVYSIGADAAFAKPVEFSVLCSEVKSQLDPAVLGRQSRKRERSTVEVEVHLWARWTSKTLVSKSTDLSEGGGFISADGNFTFLGEEVWVALFHDNKQLLAETKGSVRWLRTRKLESMPQGFGIEFANLSSESETRILTLIGRLNSPKPS